MSTVIRVNGHQRLPRRCARVYAAKMSLDLKDFNFGKLGASNVNSDLWFVKMKYLLQGKKLFSAIQATAGASSSGEGQAAEAAREAATTDAQAKAVIALCVADHLLVTVDKAASAREAWADLQAIFQSKSVAQMQRTRREFNSLKLQPGEAITDYISRAETLRSSMEMAGQQVDCWKCSGQRIQSAARAKSTHSVASSRCLRGMLVAALCVRDTVRICASAFYVCS